MGCCGDQKIREIDENNKHKMEASVEDSIKFGKEFEAREMESKDESSLGWLPWTIVGALVVVVIILVV